MTYWLASRRLFIPIRHWSDAGVVSGRSDAWHLHGALENQLRAIGEPAGGRSERLAAMVTAARRG